MFARKLAQKKDKQTWNRFSILTKNFKNQQLIIMFVPKLLKK